jgi:hypothetical protein
MLVVFEQNWLTDDVWPHREVGDAAIIGAALVSAFPSVLNHATASIVGTGSYTLSGTRNLKNAQASVLGRALHNSPVPTIHRIVYGGISIAGEALTEFDPKMIWAGGASVYGISVPNLEPLVFDIAYGSLIGKGNQSVMPIRKAAMTGALLGRGLIQPIGTQITRSSGASVVGQATKSLIAKRTRAATASVYGQATVAGSGQVNNKASMSVVGTAPAITMNALVNDEALASVLGRGRARIPVSRILRESQPTAITGQATILFTPRVLNAAPHVTVIGKATVSLNASRKRANLVSGTGTATTEFDSSLVKSFPVRNLNGVGQSYLRTSIKKHALISVAGHATASLTAGRKRPFTMHVTGQGHTLFQSIVNNIAKIDVIAAAIATVSAAVTYVNSGAATGNTTAVLSPIKLIPMTLALNAYGSATATVLLFKRIHETLTGSANVSLTTVVVKNATLNVVGQAVVSVIPNAIWSATVSATGYATALLKARRYRKNLQLSKPTSIIKIVRRFQKD